MSYEKYPGILANSSALAPGFEKYLAISSFIKNRKLMGFSVKALINIAFKQCFLLFY